MYNCIGFIEFRSSARGIEATDALLKTARVELIAANSVCAGKYYALYSGDVSAVQSATESAIAIGGPDLINSLVIANVHPDVFPAIMMTTQVPTEGSIGIIETYSAASAIVAGDAAAKAAPVKLIDIRLLRALGGKALVVLCGEVSAVRSSVESGIAAIRDSGYLLQSTVIPRPHPDLWQSLV